MRNAIQKNVEGIGIVLFERSQKAKHIHLSIRPFKGIRVALPKGVSFHQAEAFILEKRDWIQRNLIKVKKIEAQKTAISQKLQQLNIPEAKTMLVRRLAQLAERHGFSYQKVTIRNQKTKWGSCSYKNNISLNIQLACLPQRLIDYVLLHELVHTKIKNHSPQFWAELDKYVGDAKALRSQLNAYLLDAENL